MLAMGKRLAQWAPNIAVKVPATAAGIDVIEELAALGITTVGTVSFTVPQALEIGRRQQLGKERAIKAKIIPGAAFSVIMVGRLDDYLRDVAHDMHAPVKEEDIIQAGTACIKRAHSIFKDRGYEAKLMPAGMRGAYQATSLAGADMSMSLSSGIHTELDKETIFSTDCFAKPIDIDVIERLRAIPDFSRAYEPDGMKPTEFITYGATQRTLTQFLEAGWTPITEYEL
jgi:transaldolase